MLRRIPIKSVRLGMFIHEFAGSWMEHPFWRSKFLLDKVRDLERIQGSSLSELWIDTERGVDVEGDERGVTQEVAEQQIDQVLEQAAQVVDEPPLRRSVEEEVVQAAKICRKAQQAVKQMFQDARMGQALDAEQMQPLVEEIAASVMRNPSAIIGLARLKTQNEYTYMHSVAVCALMTALARQIKMSDELVYQAGLAGLLHDIGKAMIASDILDKPGKLTEAEFNAIKKHPEFGHEILLQGHAVGVMPLDVCLHHHEKVDGSGYPHGLAAEQISVLARMGAICDVYDAITSDRPYKRGWDPAVAMRKMAEWAKGHFDELLFQSFVKTVGIYPSGSLVRLSSQRLAVVVEQSGEQLLKPHVRVFFDVETRRLLPEELIDLSRESCEERILARESAEEWGFGSLEHLWHGGIREPREDV